MLIGTGGRVAAVQFDCSIALRKFLFADPCVVVGDRTSGRVEGVLRHLSHLRRKSNILRVNGGDTLDYASFLSRWRQRGGDESPTNTGWNDSACANFGARPGLAREKPDGLPLRYALLAMAYLARLQQCSGHAAKAGALMCSLPSGNSSNKIIRV